MTSTMTTILRGRPDSTVGTAGIWCYTGAGKNPTGINRTVRNADRKTINRLPKAALSAESAGSRIAVNTKLIRHNNLSLEYGGDCCFSRKEAEKRAKINWINEGKR